MRTKRIPSRICVGCQQPKEKPSLVRVVKDEDNRDEEENTIFPNGLAEGQKQDLKRLIPSQHFTQPPNRYTEATLVRAMEENGIGRPSTYANIIAVLQERKYVRLEKMRFIPEDRGRIVTVFLENFFKKYVEYDFTAQMEEYLDDISAGQMEWKKLQNYLTLQQKAMKIHYVRPLFLRSFPGIPNGG